MFFDFKKWHPIFAWKHTWPYCEGYTKKSSSWSLWEKIYRQKLHKNFSGKFGEIRAKFYTPEICLLLYPWWKVTSAPVAPRLKVQRGIGPSHASVIRRVCAYYSTRTLFTRCCSMQCVTAMNINYQRYPKTEQFMTAKISGNALKQGVEHTQCYVSAVHNCRTTRLRECFVV